MCVIKLVIICKKQAESTYHSISPALLNTGHGPELVDVFCKLLSDPLQMRR